MGADTTAAGALHSAPAKGETAMHQIILEAEAGQVSAELPRRGVAADTRVHMLVEVLDPAKPPVAALAQAGKGFDYLYSDSDLVERAG